MMAAAAAAALALALALAAVSVAVVHLLSTIIQVLVPKLRPLLLRCCLPFWTTGCAESVAVAMITTAKLLLTYATAAWYDHACVSKY
jgi:hypothetical protein